MEIVLQTSQFVVFDDVLPPEDVAALWDHVQQDDYHSVHSSAIQGVWRPQDGVPHQGSTFFDFVVPLSEVIPEHLSTQLTEDAEFPTRTPVDALMGAIRSVAPSVNALVGEPGRDWVGLVSTTYLYPVGTGFSWHDDGEIHTGAFVYYAHPEWNAHWGGELLVAHESCRGVIDPSFNSGRPGTRKHNFDDRAVSADLLRKGFGQYIAPKPNRLIILDGRHPHMVTKVSPEAGSHHRISATGFFMTAAGALRQLRLEPASSTGPGRVGPDAMGDVKASCDRTVTHRPSDGRQGSDSKSNERG